MTVCYTCILRPTIAPENSSDHKLHNGFSYLSEFRAKGPVEFGNKALEPSIFRKTFRSLKELDFSCNKDTTQCLWGGSNLQVKHSTTEPLRSSPWTLESLNHKFYNIRAYSGSEFVVANTLAKQKKVEPNEIDFSREFSQKKYHKVFLYLTLCPLGSTFVVC